MKYIFPRDVITLTSSKSILSFSNIPFRKPIPKSSICRAFSASTSVSLSRKMIPGTWDTHMHVVEPDKYPLGPSAVYVPHTHTLPQALSFESSLGIQNLVLVQPSFYGNDNSCLLDALRELTPRHGRGIVVFDPAETSTETLKEWHELGVRGVRLNLKSIGREVDKATLRRELTQFADAIRPFDWSLQVFLSLNMIPMLEEIVPDLDVKICIDHFGTPDLPSPYDSSKPLDPYSLPGFQSLVNLLRGNVWVKMSAPYRFTQDAQMRDIECIAKELLRVAGNRVIYATDWPHTRFEGKVDSKFFVEACMKWCAHEEGLAEKLFRINAEELLDVDSSTS